MTNFVINWQNGYDTDAHRRKRKGVVVVGEYKIYKVKLRLVARRVIVWNNTQYFTVSVKLEVKQNFVLPLNYIVYIW